MGKSNESFLVKWTGFFVKNYKVTILFLIAVLIAGIWGLSQNQRQDFPEVAVNFVGVSATYVGATAGDVEREVLNPLETKIESLDINIKKVRGTAGNNFGYVTIELEDLNDIKDKVAKITEAVNSVSLPEGVETKVELFDAFGPTVAYALHSDEVSKDKMLEYAPEVKTYLEGASKEIKKVDIFPEPETEIEILIKSEELSKIGLTHQDLQNAIQGFVSTLPGGSLTTEDKISKPINISVPLENLDDIKNIQIGPKKLVDIADVKRTVKNTKLLTYAGFVENGNSYSKNSVYVLAYKKEKGDIINLSKSLDDKANTIYDDNILPRNIKISKVYDTSPQIQDIISTLVQNGLMGLVLIFIVIMFFVNLRSGIVVSLIIPITFLITLFVLPLFGFTLNMLTLFAMILALGMLVDNAIVIVEGILYHIDRGVKKGQAVLLTVKELGPPITVATLTTVVVFIPFASIGGIMGEIIKYIPYTVMIMLIVSLFLAITITPLFGKWFLKEETKEERLNRKLKKWQKFLVLPILIFHAQRVIDRLVAKYGAMMSKVLKKPFLRWIILGFVATLFVLSVTVVGPSLKFEQFPKNDSEIAQVTIFFPTGTAQDVKETIAKKVGDEIAKTKYFNSYFLFEGYITVFFKPPQDREGGEKIEVMVDDLNKRLDPIRKEASEKVRIEAMAVTYGPPESDFDLETEFVSNDDEARKKAIEDLERFILKKEDQVLRVASSEKDELVSSIEVKFRKEELDKNAVNPFLASQVINSFFSESKAGSVSIKEDKTSEKIVLRYPDEEKRSTDDIKNLLIPSLLKRPVALADIANVNEVKKLESINHLDGKRVSAFKVKLKEGKDVTAFDKEVKDYLSEEKLKEYGLNSDNLSFGGQTFSNEEDFANLQIVFVLAIIGVFVIIVYQFRSYVQTLLIMITIPVAFIGILPGLKLVGDSFNMISGLGVVAVVGIVVNDAIVLIDCINRLRKEQPGTPLFKVLVIAGKARMKPILSTSITTIFGILSITIVDPFWRGLGTSIIAGLTFSTLGTLIVIPIIMYTFTGKKKRGEEKV